MTRQGNGGGETVLVVEDDESLLLGLDLNLKAEGFDVLIAKNGAAGLALATRRRPDLVVLDLLLPRMDGIDVLKKLRQRDLEMPVIILSARGELDDKVKGLSVGADDYVTKPFSLPELIARIHAALRRPRKNQSGDGDLRFGDVSVHFEGRRVMRRDAPVPLTAREFDLLQYLVRHSGRVQSREGLLVGVWGYDYEGTERTVDNFIRSLRVKLEDDPARPRYLVTVRGAGYRFDP